MLSYAVRRLLLMIPTLLGILVATFVIVQLAPGGPVEHILAQLKGRATGATATFAGSSGEGGLGLAGYRGGQGVDPALAKELRHQFGFDKPPLTRFVTLVRNYLSFDFGTSYFRDVPVARLIAEKLPVSLSLGFWTLTLCYVVSIPLGLAKAVKDGAPFDVWSSAVIVVGYAVPNFLFGVLLILLFSGGGLVALFPLRGIVSDNWASLAWPARILDYLWHMVLPVTALAVSVFATTTLLMKNAVIEEIGKQYVLTARAKGLGQGAVLRRHVLRNAILPILARLPTQFMAVFFTGSLLIETIFSLDGLGLLSYESIMDRDYPVVFASVYIFALIGLVVQLAADLLYMVIDPRVTFEARAR